MNVLLVIQDFINQKGYVVNKVKQLFNLLNKLIVFKLVLYMMIIVLVNHLLHKLVNIVRQVMYYHMVDVVQ